MAADPLGPIDLVASLKDIDRPLPAQPADIAASVDPSTEARVVAELDAAMQVANDCAEVRADLVADVKAKLQDPDYLNARVIERIAERIQGPFGP